MHCLIFGISDIYDITNETNNLVEINQFLKFKSDISQIPFDHEYINILELSFNINDVLRKTNRVVS